ncbi:hypothetical protein V5O48_007660 [Marasmius crinis-equi]|uniref:Uncharacterized protein n=1 Tax=Marasmius crinis-equi TaxID=585013 RepID=A0ABR3FG28_9AGAR
MWPWSSSPSTSSSTPTPTPIPITQPTEPVANAHNYFESIVQEELAYLRLVHPTVEETPTCMNLFDTYLSCHAIRTQLKSYYRYGTSPTHSPFPCAEKLEDWKFCLNLKWVETPEERRDKRLRRRAEWWARRRVEGKCSEDVWGVRKTFAGVGGATQTQEWPRPLTREEMEVYTHEDGVGHEGMF